MYGKDLPLHPVLVALKWDHLSDLKLADSDFRTRARIDLLLGPEVFTSILRDGWQTGSRGTPFVFNNCFGWVLFGKIHGSDVVDIVNLTLEQDILKKLMGWRCSYTAALTGNKESDLCYLEWRNR